MIRTQISLDAEEYDLAKREAERLGVSLAELLRRSLRQIFSIDREKPWKRHCGFVESGDSKSSQKIDELIYGQKG